MTDWFASWARRRTTSLWVPERMAAMAGKISPCAARRRSTNTRSKAEPAARCISFSQPCCSKVGRSGRRTPTSAAASRVRLSRTTCWAAISRPAARTRGSTPFEAAIIPACISQRPARRTRTTKSRSAAESGAALPLPMGLSGTSTLPGPVPPRPSPPSSAAATDAVRRSSEKTNASPADSRAAAALRVLDMARSLPVVFFRAWRSPRPAHSPDPRIEGPPAVQVVVVPGRRWHAALRRSTPAGIHFGALTVS